MKRGQGISLDEIGKHGKALISVLGRQNCAENGPEWVESDEVDREALMDVRRGNEKLREKRGNSFGKMGPRNLKK